MDQESNSSQVMALKEKLRLADKMLIDTNSELKQVKTESEQRINELCTELETMSKKSLIADQKRSHLETQWQIDLGEIHLTDIILGKGGWGSVNVALFRGTKVAAKSLFKQTRSEYYRSLFIREMNMAARFRHPNLVQFIGATVGEEMIILTELMHTSLRAVLEQTEMSRENIVSITIQVCRALNYLHLMQPDPVIHRDISSANVLLNPLPHNAWLAKVTDYGSVNTLRALNTVGPGNPVYAAPEAKVPSLQSTKMDVFSLGILLIEMFTGQFPVDYEELMLNITDARFRHIVEQCVNSAKDKRPTAQELLDQLS